MQITLKQLKAAGACESQTSLFKELFGESVSVTRELCMSVSDSFDWEFAACLFLSDSAWAEYDKVCASAWAECDKVRASALAECDKVCASARAECDKVRASAWAECDKVRASALAECDKVCASALAECDKVCASAWADAYNQQETIK